MIVTTVTSSPGIDANTIVESTTDSGVEIKSVVTQYETVTLLGVSTYSPAMRMTSRITIESNWEPYVGPLGTQPSTLLNSRRTTTEKLTGTPIVSSDTSHPAWTDGTHRAELGQIVQPVEIVDETFTWDEATCTQVSGLVVTQQPYSPLHSGSGFVYDDGSERAAIGYTMQEVKRENTFWVKLGERFEQHVETSQWYAVAPASWDETYGVFNTAVSIVESLNGFPPSPPTGSATIPQTSEEIIMAEYDATDATNTTGNGGYTKVTQSPSELPYPENVDELNSIAKRRIRRAMSIQYDITHNCIPFLRPGDHVALSNHARSLLGADAYVSAIKRSGVVLNGAMRQVTTVMIPPSWI